jgi:hypothetical protein
VWSLWNGSHLINLYDLSYGLDARLTDAVIVLFGAAMADALTEDQKRRILTYSGDLLDGRHVAPKLGKMKRFSTRRCPCQPKSL